MNIHFTDKTLFENLKKATLAKIIVGSHMYGTNNDDIKNGPISDTDILHIYATSEQELLSPIQTHHQLQYKENDIDYNFVSLHTFIKNILNGDSTINFETIHSSEILDTDLYFLSEYKNDFITYTMIRSYLGICRRDLKHYHKDNNKFKKLRHIIRGYLYARHMINHTFDFDACNEELLSIDIDVSNNFQLREYENLISLLRDELNAKFENKVLGYNQHFNVKRGIELSNDIYELCKSSLFLECQEYINESNINELYINAYENWVEYGNKI